MQSVRHTTNCAPRFSLNRKDHEDAEWVEWVHLLHDGSKLKQDCEKGSATHDQLEDRFLKAAGKINDLFAIIDFLECVQATPYNIDFSSIDVNWLINTVHEDGARVLLGYEDATCRLN